jgi:ABC-2 type transport system permease protein
MGNMFTPEGYLTVEFFSYMPLVLGIYAVLIASGLIASEEEGGVLDLVMGHPISRAGYFFGRLLAFITSTALMFAIIWLTFVIADTSSSLDISPAAMALPFLSLFAVILLFGTLALLLSQVLPSRRLAAMLTGIVVVASFFITSLARIDENLETIARLSPLNYYQSGEAINGLNWAWLGGLLGFSVLFTLLAWIRFQRRDLRVSGEGGWNLRLRLRSPKAA